MSNDEVIEIARSVGFRVADQFAASGTEEDMIAFAKLVASNEREACAKVCEKFQSNGENKDRWSITRDLAFHKCGAAILARGEA